MGVHGSLLQLECRPCCGQSHLSSAEDRPQLMSGGNGRPPSVGLDSDPGFRLVTLSDGDQLDESDPLGGDDDEPSRLDSFRRPERRKSSLQSIPEDDAVQVFTFVPSDARPEDEDDIDMPDERGDMSPRSSHQEWDVPEPERQVLEAFPSDSGEHSPGTKMFFGLQD